MSLSWRLLRLRARIGPCARAPVRHCSHSELQSQPSRSLTSLLHARLLHGNLSPSLPIFSSQFASSENPRTQISRRFSSEPKVESSDSGLDVVSEIFSEPRDSEEIRKRLDASNVVISYDWVLLVLQKLESCPDVARRFFEWVSENEEKRFLSSKSYNLMLGNLGVNGLVEEFWVLLEEMNKKGYGVSKFVRDRVLERFMKEGSIGNVKKLKRLFDSGSTDKSDAKVALRVCRIVSNEVWTEDVENRLREMDVKFSSDMVTVVLGSLRTDPMKALIFFRWLEESDLFKHDEKTYNAMSKVLGREDCVDRFWKVVDEMKSSEFEIYTGTYEFVLEKFSKRRMVGDAVNLYEFAMTCPNNKPSVDAATYLLKKIAVAQKLDLGLFSKVLRVFTENGNALTDSMLEVVLKSLRSVGRIGESSKVLKAMEECGYDASGNTRSKIVSLLCGAKLRNEAIKLAKSKEPDWKVWKSLIEGLSAIGDLENASCCLRKMVESPGVIESVGFALDSVVTAHCRRNKAIDAYNLLHELVSEKQVNPWHTTYQILITDLLAKGGFSEAVNVLGLMKEHEFPPFVDPFIRYVSKSGTGDEAATFLRATSKRIASTTLFLSVFEAYFKAGRRSEAQSFLAKCPSLVRNHPDVLNLFASNSSHVSPLAA